MYLIIKDPKSGTVRIEEREVPDEMMISATLNWRRKGYALALDPERADETAKSIAIKENLVYTVNPEY